MATTAARSKGMKNSHFPRLGGANFYFHFFLFVQFETHYIPTRHTDTVTYLETLRATQCLECGEYNEESVTTEELSRSCPYDN